MRWWYSALALLSWVLVAADAQLICWQAVMRCNAETECDLAYGQYMAACEGNLRGARRQCPSPCVNALIRLNRTRGGPDLESCECAQDAECLRAKRAIEPCLPRRYPDDGGGGIGCMEARQRCVQDNHCEASLDAYLSYCGQLFNGRKCSAKCKAAIQQMLYTPDGALLNRCVCDGEGRPFCEVVKENMSKLCSMGDRHGVISDQPDVDDAYEDEDYDARHDREDVYSDHSAAPRGFSSLGGLLFLLLGCIWL
ncbi:growth arrest-specific protein 1 [Hippocampus zosterae]|uniref:growth arrest-specific protein 1 n=1 Tax=Hippocampus zosterae TaxID=109293 RepID=UPI00223D6C08|nr:growth arrest-specific protein 1 [Hippocampus zosterae]